MSAIWSDVLASREAWSVEEADATLFLRALPDSCVSLVIGSPPYCGKTGRYPGLPDSRQTVEGWVEWMLEISQEAVRVSQQDVVWIANGARERGVYLPACEGLIWEWTRRGGLAERPCVWWKNSPPTHFDWFVNTYEWCVVFKKSAGPRTWFDWEAVAKPPLYKNGGHFRQRTKDGSRRRGSDYPKSKLARPRDFLFPEIQDDLTAPDVLRVTVGGGQMGSKLACEGEAPYPVGVPDYFIKTLTPPDGIVLDCFSGTGSTLQAALQNGRRFVGCDLRTSQVELTTRRAGELS